MRKNFTYYRITPAKLKDMPLILYMFINIHKR